MTVRSVIA